LISPLQLREHRGRRRARREQRVPDYHVETREAHSAMSNLRREGRALGPGMAMPRSFPEADVRQHRRRGSEHDADATAEHVVHSGRAAL